MRETLATLMAFVAFGCAAPTSNAATSTPTGAARDEFVAKPSDTVFVDVSVVDVLREDVRRDQVVVVRDGIIVAVAPEGHLALPSEITRIDGRGQFLMPGLADMHVHTFSPQDMTLFVAAGVTTVRNMVGTPQHLELRTKIAAGEVFGPTLLTAGPIVDGSPPIWPGSVELTEPADAERVVLAQKDAGYDFLKVYSMLTPAAYRALAVAAAKHEMPFAGHVPIALSLADIFASRQRSIEHLEGYLPALLEDGAALPQTQSFIKAMSHFAENADEAKLPTLATLTTKAAVWNCPTSVVWARVAQLDDPEKLKQQTRWIEYIHPQALAYWDPKADFRLKDLTAEDYAVFRKVTALQGRIVKALYEAGAKLLVGTDTGNPYVVPGAALHDEVELLVGFGMPRAAVLRAATADASTFVARSEVFGTIERGARADLVLTPNNPLSERIAIPPTGVMVKGRWHDQVTLQAKLDALRP